LKEGRGSDRGLNPEKGKKGKEGGENLVGKRGEGRWTNGMRLIRFFILKCVKRRKGGRSKNIRWQASMSNFGKKKKKKKSLDWDIAMNSRKGKKKGGKRGTGPFTWMRNMATFPSSGARGRKKKGKEEGTAVAPRLSPPGSKKEEDELFPPFIPVSKNRGRRERGKEGGTII